MGDFLPELSSPESTLLTCIQRTLDRSSGKIVSSIPVSDSATDSPYFEVPPPTLRPDRPALLVSSTSWTPDEDFRILLEALKLYEARAEELAAAADAGSKTLPKLFVIITGKGPLRAECVSKAWKLHQTWRWVRCLCLWLKAEDYPILLGLPSVLHLEG